MGTDIWHKLLNWGDHNRFKLLGVILPLVLVIGMTSCEPQAPGLRGEKVTPTEFRLEVVDADRALNIKIAEHETAGIALEQEVEAYNAQVAVTEGAFAEKYEFRRKVIEVAGGIATTLVTGGTINLGGIVTSLLALTAVGVATGSVLDGRRKDVVINNLKPKPNVT